MDNLQFNCPNKLQGCPAKVSRSDLTQHRQLCPYAPEKLTTQREQKLSELRLQLQQYTNTKARTKDKDNALYDLAKVFYEEHGYNKARQLIYNKVPLIDRTHEEQYHQLLLKLDLNSGLILQINATNLLKLLTPILHQQRFARIYSLPAQPTADMKFDLVLL